MVNPARVYTLNRRRAFRGEPTGDVETTWYNTYNGGRIVLTHPTNVTVLSQKETALPQLEATPIEDYTGTTRPGRYEDALVPESSTFAALGITEPTVIYIQPAPVTPQQVQNLQAPATAFDEVDLTWDDNPQQGWGETYSVERKTGAGGVWGVLDNNVGINAFTDSTVDPSTTYFYRVREYIPNSSFIGAYSSELQVDTPADPGSSITLDWYNTQTGQTDNNRTVPEGTIIRTEKTAVLVGWGIPAGDEALWAVGTRPGRAINQDQSFLAAGIGSGATIYVWLA